jgi:hypothetical protein
MSISSAKPFLRRHDMPNIGETFAPNSSEINNEICDFANYLADLLRVAIAGGPETPIQIPHFSDQILI